MNWSVDLCLCGELCIVLPSFIKLPNVMDYGQMFWKKAVIVIIVVFSLFHSTSRNNRMKSREGNQI